MPPPVIHMSVRVSPALGAMIDRHAAEQGISRAAWLRAAVVAQLQDEQHEARLEDLEKSVIRRLDKLQDAITEHITAEIDDLTKA